ncbi:MAG TPA: cyclic nucleotide-binding domain-containing protein [Thermoanaerobaculia bacterium]|nr:cyclic nucleotide-binding domain-containing protein [Thermoanaerobaculia bacterium]
MANPVFKTTGSGAAKKSSGANIIDLKAGEYIFQEGDLGTEMYIIHEGKVEILSQAAGEEQLLAVLEKGDFFGEMSVLEDMPRAASARALTHSVLLQINGSTFDQMLQANPEIAVRMMRKLSRRLRETDELLRGLQQLQGTAIRSAAGGARELPKPMVQVPAEGPERLVHAPSGMEFPLSTSSETTIGRKDPVTGIYPDVDLTPIDGQRSVSRRHSKIYRRGTKFFLAEEIGTMNSTYLNGARLDTGVPAELKPGDEVRCGVVILRFEVP